MFCFEIGRPYLIDIITNKAVSLWVHGKVLTEKKLSSKTKQKSVH